MKKTSILSVILVSSLTFKAQSNMAFWQPINETKISVTGKRDIVPNTYKTFHLDIADLKALLATAPSDKIVSVKNSSVIVSLPMPNGKIERFSVVESPVMEEALQASYQNIRTYSIHGIDDSYASGKLDVTEFGFHGMVRSPNGDAYIDPYCKWNTADYISYYTSDFEKPLIDRGICEGAIGENNSTQKVSAPTVQICAGTNLRTYRLAIACTGEYAVAATGLASPTKAQTLAKVVTSVNRVDGVYETEFAIRMVLVPTTTVVLAIVAGTGGFTTSDNNSASSLISKSQSVIDGNIGTANYDIGHTFSTGGGGLAQLGCVCNSGSKASGITGSSSPVGDAYDIDYVAHEMGHQFGGDHSFKSALGSCGGNGNLNTSMEPGSGVSIMAYAGICSSDDLAPHSIAYFHSINFDEIMAYSNTGGGNACPVNTASGNNPPAVTGSASYIIPANTPFSLTGSATDPNGDALTYQWEEADAATAFGAWNNGTKPFFRSYVPTTSPTRLFPKLSSILSGPSTYTTVLGEYLPTNAQTLKFRLTARDNKMGGGGVCYAITTITISASTPFAVTSQSTTGISYASGSTQTITWSVGSTSATPISCANVNIYVSIDAGLTYSLALANTPNDGTQTIVMPTVATTTATCRVKVEGAGNIFFDLNDKNFTITAATTGLSQYANATGLAIQIYPNPFSSSVKIDVLSSHYLDADNTVINVYDILGNTVRTEAIKLTENFSKVYDFSSLANGSYIVEVTDGKQKSVARLIKL
jgi:hypothetical protein